MESNFFSLVIVGLISGGALMCSAIPKDLTDEEIMSYFGTTREGAPSYAVAEVVLPAHNHRRRRDAGDSFKLDLMVHSKVKTLTFTATDGVLADSNLPIWSSSLKPGTDEIQYIRDDTAMNELGEFTFYHDLESHSAIVYYHEIDWLEGHAGYHEIRQELPADQTIPGSPKRRFLLVADSAYDVSKTGSPAGKGPPSYEGPRPNGLPKIVYPQLLMITEISYYAFTVSETVRQVITRMNSVDMIFKQVHEPEIRINLAGVIITVDNFTSPWIEKNFNEHDVLWNDKAMQDLGSYFAPRTDDFLDGNWDLVMNFQTHLMGEEHSDEGDIGGTTFEDVSCAPDWKDSRASVVAVLDISYVAVAHEIGHFFGCHHDESQGCDPGGVMSYSDDEQPNNLEWSECSMKSLKEYFSKQKTVCYDNLPDTLIAPSDLSPQDVDAVCKKAGGQASSEKVECNRYLNCGGDVEVFPPDGTKCDDTGRVCYNGQCLRSKKD